MLGFGSIASSAISSIPKEFDPITFDLETSSSNSSSIIVVSSLFDSKLVQYFQNNPEAMKTMDRRNFEELVAEIFYGFGYEVELTQRTRDGGKDIIAIGKTNEIRSKYLIECKRPNPENHVGVGVVRELMGVKADEKATLAIAVTTTHFSNDAHAFQKRNQWELDLKEYNDLVNWLNNYKKVQG